MLADVLHGDSGFRTGLFPRCVEIQMHFICSCRYQACIRKGVSRFSGVERPDLHMKFDWDVSAYLFVGIEKVTCCGLHSICIVLPGRISAGDMG